MIEKTEYFVDRLPEATVNAPDDNYISVQPITIGRETRTCLFNHPDSSVTFSDLKVGYNGMLKFGCGIKEACWKYIQAKVYFYLCIDERVVFKTTLKPGKRQKDCAWHDFEIDLKKYAGQTITLSFETKTKWGQSTEWCWAGWSDPTLTHQLEIEAPAIHKSKDPFVLIISGDAMRADFLGCYGHPTIRTPNIDQLAKENVLMAHSRSQTPCTLGAYASMVTGLHPQKHGIHAEWGIFAPERQNLPQYLRDNGYHTIFAPSEEELFRKERHFVTLFDEVIPSMARPSQDGEITTRQVLKRLQQPLDKPSFMWIQYFDTHPPNTPKEPFRSYYYDGDPTSPERAYRTECVTEIRGTESCTEIRAYFAAMEQDIIHHGLYERLKATARVFRGEDPDGPDLADHLLGIGPGSYLNMSRHEFSSWLDYQAGFLIEERPTAEFHKWLKEALRQISILENEIISWLDNVVDYRYPISQYMAAISYFDHNVGTIINTLKEMGLYDRTMLIITSPHGELLEEYGVYFHHHLLSEQVLRTPLIIKPIEKGSSRRINGIFDGIDLFPTIVDAMKLPLPSNIDGVSRWQSIAQGVDIPARDSYALDYNETMGAVVREPYIYLETYKDYYLSSEWCSKAGEKRLFSVDDSLYQENLMSKYPEIAASMEQSLREHSLSHTPVLS